MGCISGDSTSNLAHQHHPCINLNFANDKTQDKYVKNMFSHIFSDFEKRKYSIVSRDLKVDWALLTTIYIRMRPEFN